MDDRDLTSFERLLATDPRLRAFNDTVPTGILVISIEDGRVVYSNWFISELLGIAGDQLLGADWEQFFVDSEERQRLMVDFAVHDAVRNFELQLRNRHGETVWGLASLATINMDGGDLLLFTFNDVTRMKEVESDLALANEELRELAEIKNRFLGMAAHDLRTPLGAIRGMSELVTKLDLPKMKKTELVTSITEVSDQMLDLLNDLLDVTAIESGTFDLDSRPDDRGALLRQRIELVSFNAEAKGIAIATAIGAYPTIRFDRSRIGQVIDNLLTNAVKFSEPG